MKLPINKKAQAWGIDLIIGIMIFTVGILIFLVYSVNQSNEVRESLEGLRQQGDIIFSNILSEGYPKDWNETNVVNIGILDNDKINQTKIERFYNLSNNNYIKTKRIFNIQYDYFLTFDKINYNNSSIYGIGKSNFNVSNNNATNLLKMTRIGVYDNKPITLYLYIWQE